jgi:hypothetical protein
MPDGRRNNGGARPGAGRKSKAREAELERLLKKCWTKEQREEAFTKLAQRAALGSMEAVKFLAFFAFGKPVQRVLIEEDRPDKGKVDLSQLSKEELETLERAAEIVARARRGARGKGSA